MCPYRDVQIIPSVEDGLLVFALFDVVFQSIEISSYVTHQSRH